MPSENKIDLKFEARDPTCTLLTPPISPTARRQEFFFSHMPGYTTTPELSTTSSSSSSNGDSPNTNHSLLSYGGPAFAYPETSTTSMISAGMNSIKVSVPSEQGRFTHMHKRSLSNTISAEKGQHEAGGPTSPKGHPLSDSGWGTLGRNTLIGLGLGINEDEDHQGSSGFGFGLSAGAARRKALKRKQSDLGLPGLNFEAEGTTKYQIFGSLSFIFQSIARPPTIRRRSKRPWILLILLIILSILFVRSGGLNRSSSGTSLKEKEQQELRNLLQRARASSANAATLGGSLKGGVSPAVDVVQWKWRNHGKDELAALMNFILSNSFHVLPLVDSTVPLDPNVVLPFSPEALNADEQLSELVASIWNDFPVIVLGLSKDADTRAFRNLLKSLWITPEEAIEEINERADADYLRPMLARLLGTEELPLLLIHGEVVGGWKQVDTLHQSDRLVPLIESSGAQLSPPKLKGKALKQYQAEIERQRVAEAAREAKEEQYEAQIAAAVEGKA